MKISICILEDSSTPKCCGSPEFRSRSLVLWCYNERKEVLCFESRFWHWRVSRPSWSDLPSDCSSGRRGVSREIPLSVMVTFLTNRCMHANLFPGQCAAQCSVDAFTVRKLKRKRSRNVLEEHTRRKIQLWTGIAFYFNLYIQNICKYVYILFSE